MAVRKTICLPGYRLPKPLGHIAAIISFPFAVVWALVTLPWWIKAANKKEIAKTKKYGFNPENGCLSIHSQDETNEIYLTGNRDGLLRVKAEIDEYASGEFDIMEHWHLDNDFSDVNMIFFPSDKNIFEYGRHKNEKWISGSPDNWRQVSGCIDKTLEAEQCSLELSVTKDKTTNQGTLIIKLDNSLHNKKDSKEMSREPPIIKEIVSWVVRAELILWLGFGLIIFIRRWSIEQALLVMLVAIFPLMLLFLVILIILQLTKVIFFRRR